MSYESHQEIYFEPKQLATKYDDYINCQCPICHNIFLDPKACGNCLNHFCQKCIRKWNISKPRKCPLCKQYIQKQAAPILKTLLQKLSFFCPQKINGCEQIIPYGEYIEHAKQCQFKMIKCSHRGCKYREIRCKMQMHEQTCCNKLVMCNWCGFKFKRVQIDKHNINCPYKIVVCKLCDQQIKQNQNQNHLQICPKMLLKCQHCQRYLQRFLLNDHLNLCQQRIINCIGCQKSFKLNQYYTHQNTCQDQLIVCNKCMKILKKKQLQNHSNQICMISLNGYLQNEIKIFRREIKMIKEQMNDIQRLKEQEQKYDMKTKFSLINKDYDIYTDQEYAVVREQKKRKRDRIILLETKPLANQQFTFMVQIESLKSQWLSIGITDQTNLSIVRRMINLGNHCCNFFQADLVNANGYTYSNHNVNQNWQQTTFVIEQKDIISCNYVPENSILKFSNLTKGQVVSISLDMQHIHHNHYYPMISFRNPGEKVRLIN